MLTVFERVPDWFIERYDDEMHKWGMNWRKVNYNPDDETSVHSIMLREGQLSDSSPDPKQGPELIFVKLIGKRFGSTMYVSPLTERDERLIALHCEKMERLKVSPRLVLPEPLRPWLPFMPTVGAGRPH